MYRCTVHTIHVTSSAEVMCLKLMIFFSSHSIVAVLLENFSIFYNDEETNLDLAAMKDFKRKWRKFDIHAKVCMYSTFLIKM